MKKNFFSAIGVVETVTELIDSSVMMPILRVSFFNKETETWSFGTRVVITEDADIRMLQHVQEGDIVLFQGILSYIDDVGEVIYATSALVLSKNKKQLPIKYRRVAALGVSGVEMCTAIALGTVVSIPKDGEMFVLVSRDFPIRGIYAEHETLKIHTDTTGVDVGDEIFFSGGVKHGELFGEIKITNKYNNDGKESL